MNIVPHNPAPNNPLQFIFEGYEIRVIIGSDGEPLFVASDICAALEVPNISKAVMRLDADEKTNITLSNVDGAIRELVAVTEPGMYRLIGSSRKQTPQVIAFKRWMYHEVLPSIRKTGSYSLEKPTSTKEIDHLDAAEHIIITLRQQRQELAMLQWQQDNTQSEVQQIDTRVTKLEKRPAKNYFTVADYVFNTKQNVSLQRIALMEQRALKLSSEQSYEVQQLAGDNLAFHEHILKQVV